MKYVNTYSSRRSRFARLTVLLTAVFLAAVVLLNILVTSLANRFGVTINFAKPSLKEYFDIVLGLAHRLELPQSDDEIKRLANAWAMRHGGFSGRTAQQFINHLCGNLDEEEA